ncbi:MAG: hypothetical protein MUF62_09030 [Chitinophagaceae bacterium]|nr:hypothetical protein [Chitinophagaceae bacterium]
METIVIEITSPKAYKLLEDLEDMQVLKVIRRHAGSTEKLSEKYAGKLPASIAEQMNAYVDQSRAEWNDNGI